MIAPTSLMAGVPRPLLHVPAPGLAVGDDGRARASPVDYSLTRAWSPTRRRTDSSHDDGLGILDDTPSQVRQSRIVDSAIYVEGSCRLPRVAGRDLREPPPPARRHGLDRPLPPRGARGRIAGLGVRAPPPGGRGRHPRPPATEDRTLRRHPVRRAPSGSIRRRHRGGRVRRGPRLRRPEFVLTVRHSEAPEFSSVRRRLESQPDLLRRGPEAVLYAVLDKVVDGYYPVVAGLGNDIDEIEAEVFSGDPKVSRRIYELSREVADFQRATRPLTGMIAALIRRVRQVQRRRGAPALPARRRGPPHPDRRARRRVPPAPRDMLTVNATLVAQQQNEEMRSPGRGRATSRTRRSRRSPHGRPSCSRPRSSAPSTA